MWRRGELGAVAAGVLLAMASGVLAARAAPAGGAGEADEAVEAYLQQHGLRTLLADQLAARLAATDLERRGPLAERLGTLYVELLERTQAPEEREAWLEKARELLRRVPEAQALGLRVDIAKAGYARAEQLAERERLRLAGGEEKAEAERLLRSLKQQFESVATDLARKVDGLERLESSGRANKAEEEQLAEARRLRSVAQYYAGWAGYYLASVTGAAAPADDALRAFGWLTGTPAGQPASLERLPRANLKYEHIARAAVGCALCMSLKGDDVEAARWLEAVESSPETPPAVKGVLLPRRIAVYASARRWADVERIVRAAREAPRVTAGTAAAGAGGGARPLEPDTARLLAVVALEADRKAAGAMLESLAQVALGDLIAQGQIANVLDLARRYGTAPLGESGFIVNYVRGVQAYEQAAASQKAAGDDPEAPAKDPRAAEEFRAAATLLGAAVEEPDGARFVPERVKATILQGRALYHASRFVEAGEVFARGATLAATSRLPKDAEESLWLGIVALDRGAKEPGQAMARARLEELSALYLRSYPTTPRAATLILNRADQAGLGDEEAVRILMGVPKDAPVHLAARRQAARVLYRMFRGAGPDDRPFAASRFVAVAEEVLEADRALAVGQDARAAKEAVERVLVGARQLLDALLGVPAPDLGRAQAVLDLVQTVAVYNRLDLAKYAEELAFRRFQITLARGDVAGAERLAEELLAAGAAPGAPASAAGEAEAPAEGRRGGGRFAQAALRTLYARAAERFRVAEAAGEKAPESEERKEATVAAARDVLRLGGRVIDGIPRTAEALKDPGAQSLYNTVADAGEVLWLMAGDAAARDGARELDRLLLMVAPASREPLARTAVLAEGAGDLATALAAWGTLSAGLEAGTPGWHRARYEFIRLTALTDPAQAAALLAQHAVLYPGMGPEPWAGKFKELRGRLPATPTPAPATPAPAPAPATPGAGGGS